MVFPMRDSRSTLINPCLAPKAGWRSLDNKLLLFNFCLRADQQLPKELQHSQPLTHAKSPFYIPPPNPTQEQQVKEITYHGGSRTIRELERVGLPLFAPPVQQEDQN